MNHKILQVHATYTESGQLETVTVLANINGNGDIRALQSVNTQMSGYHWIKPNDQLNQEMINNVVSSGYEVNSFPGYKSK